MEQYEAMMESGQLPPIPTSNHNALASYPGGHIAFPQFSDGGDNNPLNSSAGYGSLPPGMTVNGSYPTTPTTPVPGSGASGGGVAANLSLGGYSTPGSAPPGSHSHSSHSQASPYSGNNSSTSFSMPYDPPPQSMQTTPTPSSLPPMPTPPPQSPQQHAQHNQQHQQSSMKPIYSCTYCGLVLSSNNALIEHKRIHTGERPYACQVCDKRFTQKAHLNIHKRIHTGEKPYACHICHKRFAQSSHLSSHKRIHTGEKPFVCGICHLGFTQKQRLDAHLKKHMERPGQDISPVNRRAPLDMANHQARMADRMEAYRQGVPKEESVNMMHMVGQGMPYIKQEIGIGEMASPNHNQSNHSLHHQHPHHPGMDEQSRNDARDQHQHQQQQHHAESRERGQMDGAGEQRREQIDVDMAEKNQNIKPDITKNQNINAPSFSSEGMFLHPSGYVAYGGIEDNEESDQQQQQHQQQQPNQNQQQQSPRIGGEQSSASVNPSSSSLAAQQQQQSGHRRKSSFVRKRQSESPDKIGESGEHLDVVNGLHRFNALNQHPDAAANPSGANGGVEDEEEEEDDDEEVVNGVGEDYKDTGEVLDDKNDPPYQGSMHNSNAQRGVNTTGYDHPGFRKVTVPVGNVGMVETRSHARRTSSGHDDGNNMVNGGGDRMNPGVPSISYAGPANSYSNSGLVKVNNRISLVNFTADELLTHLMKRDDVNCCQFCCLVFQDPAMYHIHRNMHDKQDIRKCNMCGKMLLDKYDFTAHFLSMHQH